jgi:hypothetical protein
MSQSATIPSASGAKSDIEASTIRAISWRLIPASIHKFRAAARVAAQWRKRRQ